MIAPSVKAEYADVLKRAARFAVSSLPVPEFDESDESDSVSGDVVLSLESEFEFELELSSEFELLLPESELELLLELELLDVGS